MTVGVAGIALVVGPTALTLGVDDLADMEAASRVAKALESYVRPGVAVYVTYVYPDDPPGPEWQDERDQDREDRHDAEERWGRVREREL